MHTRDSVYFSLSLSLVQIRELKERKKREFFQIDADDSELQRLKERMQQHRTSPEHTPRTDTK